MNIILLTHQRELSKKTNTGSLVVDVLGNSARILVWERTKPNEELLALINEGSVALLYPAEDSELISKSCSFNRFKHYVVIDGTWQEARKIYNKSPYLHDLPTVKVETSAASIYTLRRNQKESGLCTAECVAEVMNAEGFDELAEILQGRLLDFLSNRG